jgi:ElaB/YqjD/DUF883 family membrane-anchored ribosome-binding protein
MAVQTTLPESGANGQGQSAKYPGVASAERIPSRISREFSDFVADVEDLITKTTSLTGEDLVRPRAQLSDRVAEAKISIQELGGSIVHRARKTATATNEYVHDEPWKAIGIGAVVGVLFGFLLGRRK